MAKLFINLRKICTRKGVIESIADETQRLGSHALIISDEVVWNITKDQIDQSFSNNSEVNYDYETFKGESSENEINRIVDESKTKGIDVVIGLGGGKALDTGKAVANALNASVIDFASTASMDAPTAAVSVIYDDNGVFSGYEFYPKNRYSNGGFTNRCASACTFICFGDE